MFERFDAEHLFNEALKNGITLFCGAGFSVLAQDSNGENLPVGSGLLEELKREFDDINTYNNLPRACTKIIRSDKNRFYHYIEQRFTVNEFDPLYLSLTKVNVKSIYTTNIDDLFFKIWENAKTHMYLKDRSKGDEYDNNFVIDYFPLHGCVKNKKGYVFGTTEIATAFSQIGQEKSWKRLSKDSSNNPILFWGWNFEDSGPIEAMYGNDSGFDNNVQRWVMLYKPTEETIDFLESLNFNIIIGETSQMLKYIEELDLSIMVSDNIKKELSNQFSKYCIPLNDSKLPSYSINRYFTDYAPQWSHIYSGKIPKIRYYTIVADYISSGQDVIVIGIRCSGKTTLMM